ncbi:hypothetical protein CPB84DRAFT_1678495 [Gymnopilus junonius]|uniref:Uncharacterized protein n=1 Tax=Gymnopilus junonius TaxID=109634 RepID=A0A9P5NQJ4_GYMJU|nr:hypothetical protein CPB84DRAFT_1678495 [Gymnopilus junonius]
MSSPGPSESNHPPGGTLDSGLAVELPNEIQRIIFEHAASLDGKCALRLCQVAKYVYTWVRPILYQRIVMQDPRSAISFFKTLRTKPRGHFEPMIRSLAVESTVTLPQAKAILVECSRRILLLTIFRKGSSRERILHYIKSPYLKRLTMVCHRDWDPNERQFGQPNAQYDIPVGLVASLTHLAIIIDYESGSWIHLVSALLASVYPDNDTYVIAYSAFQNLTHVATSVQGLNHNVRIRRVAQKLRYFAILEPREYSLPQHERLVARVRTLERSAEYPMAAPRSMVILRDLGDPHVWKVQDSFRPSDFWKEVERLVDGGFISDRGERWYV